MFLNSKTRNERPWHRARHRHHGKRHGLGLVSTSVGQTPTLVFSSSPIAGTVAPIRNILSRATAAPVSVTIQPAWGSNPPRNILAPIVNPSSPTSQGSGWQSGGNGGWNAQSNPWGSTPQNPNNSQALAAAQALLQTNPSLLTQQQFTMLQQAGLVSNTLPYSSVSNINPTSPLTGSTAVSATAVNDPNCVAAGCTGGPYPNCTCPATATSDIGTTLSETVAGLPLYLWLLIGGGGILLLTRKGR